MTPDDVELVARAICAPLPEGPDVSVSGFINGEWKKLGPAWKIEWTDSAKSVLTALEAAGWRRVGEGDVVVPRETWNRIRFEAGIDVPEEVAFLQGVAGKSVDGIRATLAAHEKE